METLTVVVTRLQHQTVISVSLFQPPELFTESSKGNAGSVAFAALWVLVADRSSLLHPAGHFDC